MKVHGNELVEKRNVLNEFRGSSMGLQELRFFSIYLSKINARDLKTRVVRFPISDFQKIMDLGRMNIQHFKAIANSLLCKVVNVPLDSGGLSCFQLFKECTLDQDEFGQWYIEIDAHDKSLELMFDFKERYFSYELCNALRLKSPNQLRMYEILKQFEKIGKRQISIIDLKDLLGIESKKYPRWNNLKQWVIDSCQEALKENTDIKFTYDVIKNGRGGKITDIVFYISKNKNFKGPLSLGDYLKTKEDNIIELSDEEYTVRDITEEISFEEKKATVDKDRVKKELAEAQENPLWWVAKMLTDRKKDIEFPERYALGILKNWADSGYKTIEDLIANCIVTEADIKANKKKYVKDEYAEFIYNYKWEN